VKRVVALLSVFIVGVSIAYHFLKPGEEDLPILSPVDVNEELVDPELRRKGMGHTIGEFSFTNQNGETITSAEVEGKVHVAEYFFTTCKSICPVMNKQMKRVYRSFQDQKDFRILSFTVDPEVDTVEQMKRYADDHGATGNSWHFLTGEKAELYNLARKSYFVLKPAEAQNLGDAGSDFIHTNNFVLVDKKGRIRGYYDGTSAKEVSKLIHDIRHLLEE
jgi:protein SCO1/2